MSAVRTYLPVLAACVAMAVWSDGSAAKADVVTAVPSSPGATNALPEPASASRPFVVTDARPEDEKKTHEVSTSITSCEFGVMVWGDDVGSHLKPKVDHMDRIQGLRDRLTAALGDRLLNHQLVVDHFGLYANIEANQTAAALLGPVGAVASIGTNTAAKCSQDKMPAGWFQGSELTTPYPPYIVQMIVHLDGQPIEFRTVHSPQRGENVRVSILSALDQAGAELTSRVSNQLK